MLMSVTIKDVAKAANVSVATVSRVLNKKSNVSEEAIQAVNSAVQALGYSPSFLGRDLRKSETRRILAIIASTEQSFYSDVIRGMEVAAFSQGYDVLIATTHDDPNHEMHLLGMLFSRAVDGAVLLGPKLDAATINSLGEKHNIAMCLERLDNCNVLTVTIDNVKAGRDAVNYLIRKGHKKIGLITTLQRSQSSIDREIGYVYFGGYETEQGMRGCEYLMNLPSPPTAIFSISDIIAIGAMNYALSKGYRIGKDLIFMGFDNIQYSHMFVPHLSTVEQPCYAQGKLVIEKLIENMKATNPDHNLYTLPHSLVLRESTGD